MYLLHSLLLPEDWKICQKMDKASTDAITKQNQQQVIIVIEFTEITQLFLCGMYIYSLNWEAQEIPQGWMQGTPGRGTTESKLKEGF